MQLILFSSMLVSLLFIGGCGGRLEGAANPVSPPATTRRSAEVSLRSRVIASDFRHGQGVSFGDLTGDGTVDLVAALSLTDQVRAYSSNSGVNGGIPVPIGPAGDLVAMNTALVDYDRDGDLDVVAVGLFVREPFRWTGAVRAYSNALTTGEGWSSFDLPLGALRAPRSIVSGDFDRDGWPDLAVGALGDPNENIGHGLSFYRHTGNARSPYADGSILLDGSLRNVEGLIAGDLDQDGWIDLVATSRDTSEIVWFRNQSGMGFERRLIGNLSLVGSAVILQADADPQLEVAAVGEDSAGKRVTLFDARDGFSTWRERSLLSAVGSPAGAGDTLRLTAGDLTGDGRSELVFTSRIDGTLIGLSLSESGGIDSIFDIGREAGVAFVAARDISGDERVELITTTYDFSPERDRLSVWEYVF
jgi:hypothetical protein